jgi:hypothetical protein
MPFLRKSNFFSLSLAFRFYEPHERFLWDAIQMRMQYISRMKKKIVVFLVDRRSISAAARMELDYQHFPIDADSFRVFHCFCRIFNWSEMNQAKPKYKKTYVYKYFIKFNCRLKKENVEL